MRSLGIRLIPLFLLASLSAQQPAPARKLDSADLQRAHLMLKQAHDEIRKNYYDPAFHGIDIDKTYQQFDARLDASQSINETFRVVAAYMLNLHDSHLFFMPPMRSNRSSNGFFMEMIGDKCFITRIRPGTDAAVKLHVGDQVTALNGFAITPAAFENIRYFVQDLSPAPAEQLDLISPTGEPRKEVVKATLRSGKAILDLSGADGADFWQLVRAGEEDDHLSRSRYLEDGNTFIWRMPTFEVAPTDLNKVFNKAVKHDNLIIDLRGNPGGYIPTLLEMLGHFFDHEIKMGDLVTRKETKPQIIKPRAPYYSGHLTVLIDHNSASCAELFTRVIQIEKRGRIIGDKSAGAVMEAQDLDETIGTDYQVNYGFSITSANILMTDGKSLENIGVTPDELLLPTAADLAAGKDPVLAHAAELNDAKLDSTAAAKLFPYEWPAL
jgi:carboxyl-terminal processing protease